MATYQSIIAYDGTEFAGFQRQSRRRTVQGELEKALRRLGWSGRAVLAAGRTDTGAHARGQVVAFELTWRRSPEALTAAINAHLPQDISVQNTRLAQDGFHPRYSAVRRQYSYTLILAAERDPLRERFAWRIWPALDDSAIRGACPIMLGEHDFRAFGPAPRKGGGTRRTVFRSEWQGKGLEQTYRIEADAFLYRMVRRIVSALVSIGRGELGSGALSALLEDPTSRWQGALAPAKGLCLDAVIYDENSPEPGRLSGGRVEGTQE